MYRLVLAKPQERNRGKPDNYNAHVLRRGAGDADQSLRMMTGEAGHHNLRTFLRYLVVYNLCDATLVDALPTIAHWKRTSCPDDLSEEEVEKLVVACNPVTAEGARVEPYFCSWFGLDCAPAMSSTCVMQTSIGRMELIS